MICKWCGAKNSLTDGKCARCHREWPELSDCGGFYDLVPKAERVSSARKSKTAKHKGLGLPWVLLLCGTVALVTWLLVSATAGGDQGQKPEAIRDSDKPSNSTHSPKDELESEIDDPVSLSEQEVSISFVISGEEDKFITTTVDLHEHQVKVTSWSVMDDLSLEAGVGFEDNSLTMELRYSGEEGRGVLTPKIDTQGRLWSKVKGRYSYCWEWHFGDGQWTGISAEAVSIDNGKLIFDIEMLKTLCSEQEGDPVIRLLCSRKNQNGGRVTVELAGIAIMDYIDIPPMIEEK